MPYDLQVIAAVMLITGALGGLVNWFLSSNSAPRPAGSAEGLAWWKHIIIGIAVSFMVPLLLNMISANLIAQIRGGGTPPQPGDPSKLLILAGLCLATTVLSRSLTDSLSQRLLREARQAHEQAAAANLAAEQARHRAMDATTAALAAQEEAQVLQKLVQSLLAEEPAAAASAPHAATSASAAAPVALPSHDPALAAPTASQALSPTAASVTASPTNPATPTAAPAAPPHPSGLNSIEEATVLHALIAEPMALRTVAGIAQDSQLDEATVETVLATLQQKAWALPLSGSDSRRRWFATAAGKALVAPPAPPARVLRDKVLQRVS